MEKSELSDLLAQAGFQLPGAYPAPALDQLHSYLKALLKWNEVMNLVGPYSGQEMVRELLLDSFHLAAFLEGLTLPANFKSGPDLPRCWDFGAGAGIPGIPLRILWQKGEYHLVEPREKRALFMQKILAELRLPRTQVHRARAEDFMPGRPQAHLLISRAFLPWPELLALAGGSMDSIDKVNVKAGGAPRPSILPGGLVICLANEDVPAQLPEAWSLFSSARYTLPTSPAKERFLWALRLTRDPNWE